MIFIRKVSGDSMNPTLVNGQIVYCHRVRNFKVGQVVIAFVKSREVIKRIGKIENGKIFLTVDNTKHAHNGEFYASITDSKIEGVVFWPRNL